MVAGPLAAHSFIMCQDTARKWWRIDKKHIMKVRAASRLVAYIFWFTFFAWSTIHKKKHLKGVKFCFNVLIEAPARRFIIKIHNSSKTLASINLLSS